MIRKSFILLEGIGENKENLIWNNGISDWNSFINADKAPGISKKRKILYDLMLKKASNELIQGNKKFFSSRMKIKEHWRLYNHFRDESIFLDIEASSSNGFITCITLSDSYNTKTFVKNINLDLKEIKRILSCYSMIITFNGSSYDIPILNRWLKGIVSDQLCWDLRHSCSHIELDGGLKNIEKKLGIKRENEIIERMHGGDPYLLWKMFMATGDRHYLELLVEYNQEDAINLMAIADKVYPKLVERKINNT